MPNDRNSPFLKGVVKVVNLLLASSNGICQKLLAAFRIEKTVAPPV